MVGRFQVRHVGVTIAIGGQAAALDTTIEVVHARQMSTNLVEQIAQATTGLRSGQDHASLIDEKLLPLGKDLLVSGRLPSYAHV